MSNELKQIGKCLKVTIEVVIDIEDTVYIVKMLESVRKYGEAKALKVETIDGSSEDTEWLEAVTADAEENE